MDKVHPRDPPSWYLLGLGTVKEHQGKGLGSAVLSHMLSRCDTEGLPAYLESSNPRNVPLLRPTWLRRARGDPVRRPGSGAHADVARPSLTSGGHRRDGLLSTNGRSRTDRRSCARLAGEGLVVLCAHFPCAPGGVGSSQRASVSWSVPETRYARASDDVHIAYQVTGEGPLDLVMVPGFVSHVELAWDMPASGEMIRRVESFSRTVSL